MNEFTSPREDALALVRAFLEVVEKIDAITAHLPAHKADEISAVKNALFDVMFESMPT